LRMFQLPLQSPYDIGYIIMALPLHQRPYGCSLTLSHSVHIENQNFLQPVSVSERLIAYNGRSVLRNQHDLVQGHFGHFFRRMASVFSGENLNIA